MSKVNLSKDSIKSDTKIDEKLAELINLKGGVNDPSDALIHYRSLTTVQSNFNHLQPNCEGEEMQEAFHFVEGLREYFLKLHLYHFESDTRLRDLKDIAKED